MGTPNVSWSFSFMGMKWMGLFGVKTRWGWLWTKGGRERGIVVNGNGEGGIL